MSFFDNRYYHLNKLFLSLIGLWPYQSRLEGIANFTISFLLICSLTYLEFWGLIKGITNIDIAMENGPALLVNMLMFIKLTNYLWNRCKMRKLLALVEEGWSRMQVGPENEILRYYAEQSRSLTIKYATCIYLVILSYTMMPFIISGIYLILPLNETYSYRFLYRLEHVIDVDKYFKYLMLHATISMFYLVSVTVAIDSMFVLCIQHVCALFEIIRYNMERIQGSDFVELKPNLMNDEGYHTIIGNIKLYNHAVRFSDMLSSAFATCFLFLLGNVAISLSFTSAELLLVGDQLDEVIRIMAAAAGQLLHIFYLSMTSQRLIDHSSGIQIAIYNCNWYTLSLRSRQLLKLILLRTTRPCQIKAGKIFIMSMENFSSIIQTSVSYFTMLTSLQ